MADGTHILTLLNQPVFRSGLEQLEALEAHPDCGELLRKAARREITRAHAARREHEGSRGVAWSAMANDPYSVRSVEEIQAEAEADEARMFSPRGRFLAALAGAEEIDPAKAHQVRGIWCRDLADEREPLNTAAVGAALALLNGIAGKDARNCIDALSALLMDTGRRAA